MGNRAKLKTRYKYIHFEQRDDTFLAAFHDLPVYLVVTNKESKYLGTIQWFEPWKEFCFFPCTATLWSKECLSDIIDFFEQLEKGVKDDRGKKS